MTQRKTRTLWAVLLAAWLLAVPARAQVAQADAAAIEGVIRSQLAALLADDAAAAYAHASPMIRGLFPDAAIFLRMVARAYPPIHRAREARFRPPEIDGETIRQPVVVQGPDGRFWLAIYAMQRQPDGRFVIDGCVLVELPQVGA
jgi:hypothetical protein